MNGQLHAGVTGMKPQLAHLQILETQSPMTLFYSSGKVKLSERGPMPSLGFLKA
jgi:hypothetical protein